MLYSLAMRNKNGNLHLEIQTSRKSPVGILRTSFRDKDSGKILHSQVGRITGCSFDQLKLLQLAFRGKVLPDDDPRAFRILTSKEHGASRALLQLTKDIGLHRILYSRTEPWVDCVLAMIVGRIVYQGSKLSLCNQWENTSLWELCGIHGRPDVEDHCYLPLDRLLERQEAIQKKLVSKHLKNGCLVLYDITSTYFEGEYKHSDIVRFGYNRDKKRGHEQIVIGLMCTSEGCPVGCEVFPGNTTDCTTVMGKIAELRELYGLEKVVFVGDRGMVTKSNLNKLRDIEGLNTISALTHGQMRKLLERKVIEAELFDEKNVVEVIDPENNQERYCLCRNLATRDRERATRHRLIELTKKGLEEIADYKRKVTVEVLGARVGKLLAKYKMGKFFQWSVEPAPETQSEPKKPQAAEIEPTPETKTEPKKPQAAENPKKSQTPKAKKPKKSPAPKAKKSQAPDPRKSLGHQVKWSLEKAKIAEEELMDGCYIINTNASKERFSTDEVVANYKGLQNVESAFRSLKQVHLEMRPVYHKIDRRIKAHVFLCTLSYYVQWHMMQRVKPLLENRGKDGKERRWTVQNIVERLKQVCRNQVQAEGVKFHQMTELDEEQREIINLLQVAL